MRAPHPIHRLAIANRGEAAMRCIRAVKALRAEEGSDLQAIALYTAVDRDAPFVRHADGAIEIASPRGAAAAYLDHDVLLAALRRCRADAVWPGWGFVAEDPVFVERLGQANIRFLGPDPPAMRRLGDKIASKELAERAGVPVTPWSGRALADAEDALRCARRLGFPVVIKASAGGGGRGIRMVETPEQLAEAFRGARSEAAAAFGDDRLFVERKIAGGRHIEVQIAADLAGQVLALGCRDCSVQRRHQKVIEEAPPPGIARRRLRELEEAAVRLAREVGYVGLGTVEFLVTDGEFHFLEMNPRLQVEHGITEETTGLDLVRLQIRIARGESIAKLAFEEHGVAIEARVCAEDPDAGFCPSPGRIACFDPSLGPRVRLDSGFGAGSQIPPDFDSLVAKVIACGDGREEARARLRCALADLDLVIEGGATNKGFLLEILDAKAFRSGGVDTTWLDRFAAEPRGEREYAVEALVAAAILSYQASRAAARLNFFSDTTSIAPSRVPPSLGQQIDLSYRGESYRLEVYTVGSWRYRVHLEGRVVSATLREEGAHTARLAIGDRSLRILHDVTESGLRVEIEGHAHRFGGQAAGQVRAGTPAMVVAIHVEAGQRVAAGQPLGVLEAMKTEIGFEAPVSGVVTEVRARRGQQVAAGEVLLVIDPAGVERDAARSSARLVLFDMEDPLEPLFTRGPDGGLGEPDLRVADAAPAAARQAALEAAREEVRRVLLGYDASGERTERLAAFLNAPLPEGLSEAFRRELAAVRGEIAVFAEVEQLFIRAPRASVGGEVGPSNSARLRIYVRRMRAGGAGISEEFLALVRAALAHYGVHSLEHSDALERAVMRLLATQHTSAMRQRLVLAMLRRLTELAQSPLDLAGDRALEVALTRISGMRGLVSDTVADSAADASYLIFERPRLERLAERTSSELEQWLATAEARPSRPPEEVLAHLADAPRPIFDRIGRWLADPDPRRRAIAAAAHLRRLYSPEQPLRDESSLSPGGWFDRIELGRGRMILGSTCEPAELPAHARRLLELAAEALDSDEWPTVEAIEVLVPVGAGADVDAVVRPLASVAAPGAPKLRLTVTAVDPDGGCVHRTFAPTERGLRPFGTYHGIHPEAARRIDLGRLANFELERLPADGDGIYCFHGRSRSLPADERIFVLADARIRSSGDGRDAALFVPAFEHAFTEATRELRSVLNLRDPKRRMQWNRIALYVAPAIFLDADIAWTLARRLAPATRNLGLEKVVVRLEVLDRAAPARPARPIELVISDPTGSSMEIHQREPHTEPLEPRSDYERKVVEARRRRLVYPYEIVRMLTGSGRGPAPPGLAAGPSLPIGTFEEYDLAPGTRRRAVSVAERPFGRNQSSIVFGIIRTPTEKVPEGMSRVLVLSDPTLDMGALAAPECDRLEAALDLAAERGIPVEWIPVSSGARIAMDSGTENLDATARVVRKIVEFTQAGGVIHVIVTGVNVGAQSYFDALATMLSHTRGALVMTPRASMVLTGRAALEASGAVSAEDEVAIGGFERIMGPNGEAQYFAHDLADAYRILYEHYRYTCVVPGEAGPRRFETRDPIWRDVGDSPCGPGEGEGFATVREIFDDRTNPGRKRPFPMRAVMAATIDQDGGHLERWRAMVGAETAIVWDAHLGGIPVCLIGIESQSVEREGYRPLDGPQSWTAGTLFPLSSKKVARAINAASGNRPVVVLANLSGFDGSPESMRKLQLEYGAEIARAVVNFAGPILFLVVSRYHGGAYVVFSQALNPGLSASALEGSYASVIGGGPAAAVVFGREVRARALADPQLAELEKALRTAPSAAARERFERALADAMLEHQSQLAADFDAIHSVERARRVGSLSAIVEPRRLRPFLIGELARALRARS
jgi:acetyl/propionyl-CoA carboxylase alpha subunit/acetyl-CoA carboxylase carboxyltransferase component